MEPSLSFKPSQAYTLGIELELQLIHPETFNLMAKAKDLLRYIKDSEFAQQIKPEVTQSMIEVNSSIHAQPHDLFLELKKFRDFLVNIGKNLGFNLCGGGTHPFQLWRARKIFPSHRFRHLWRHHGYLAKRFTVFSQHIHIGCTKADDAIYLTHTLARFLPQLILLSASSPFYQGVDTAFDSSRVNVASAFPTSGYMPFVKNWEEFQTYFNKIKNLKIIDTIKDIYWDIRPKPESGTVEVRICDTPLNIAKSVALGAYVQVLTKYLLEKRPFPIIPYDVMIYRYNQFQASRYGFQGEIIDPYTEQTITLIEDLTETLNLLKAYQQDFNNEFFLDILRQSLEEKQNDACWLRKTRQMQKTLPKTVQEQCKLWAQ